MFPGMNAEGLGKQARKAIEMSRTLAMQVRTMLSLHPCRCLNSRLCYGHHLGSLGQVVPHPHQTSHDVIMAINSLGVSQ